MSNELPKLIRIESIDSYEDASCPHCGARGRHIYTALAEGGEKVRAMSGCIKLFPKSALFPESMRVAEKEKDYAARGWELGRFDKAIKRTIDEYVRGEISIKSAMVAVNRSKSAAVANSKRR